MKPINPHKDQTGLSLLELLTSLALTAILSLAAVPALSAFRSTAALKSEIRLLHNTLTSLTISAEQTEKKIQFKFNNSSWETQYEDALTPYKHELKSGLTLWLKSASGLKSSGSLKFYRSGVSMPATLFLTTPEKTCQLTISLRGRISSLC